MSLIYFLQESVLWQFKLWWYCFRQGQLLNVRGEKVSEDVLQSALEKTANDWELSVRDYTTVESHQLHSTGIEQGYNYTSVEGFLLWSFSVIHWFDC